MSRFPLPKVALALLVAAAVLFTLGSVGQHDGGLWEDGPSWLGSVGWFGFLICVPLLVVTVVMALVRRYRHQEGPLPH